MTVLVVQEEARLAYLPSLEAGTGFRNLRPKPQGPSLETLLHMTFTCWWLGYLRVQIWTLLRPALAALLCKACVCPPMREMPSPSLPTRYVLPQLLHLCECEPPQHATDVVIRICQPLVCTACAYTLIVRTRACEPILPAQTTSGHEEGSIQVILRVSLKTGKSLHPTVPIVICTRTMTAHAPETPACRVSRMKMFAGV